MARPGAFLLLFALALSAARAQEGLVQALGGEQPSASAVELPSAARKSGLIHHGPRVAGRYYLVGPVEVTALRVLAHQPNRRLRVELVLRARWGGVFRAAHAADARLSLDSVSALGGEELRVEATLDAQGATDDVVGRISLRVEPRLAGRSLGRVLAVVALWLPVGADPVDVAERVIEDGRWRWMEAGSVETDYERFKAGRLAPEAIRSANCYQFVKYALAGAGVPERERPLPLLDGQPRPEEALAYKQGFKRGSPGLDQASMNRGLRDYVWQYAGHYRLTLEAERYQPRRGDLVIYYMRDGSGTLQAMHVAMFTGQGDDIVHNRGSGPQRGHALGLIDRAWWDAIGVYEYVGGTPIEGR